MKGRTHGDPGFGIRADLVVSKLRLQDGVAYTRALQRKVRLGMVRGLCATTACVTLVSHCAATVPHTR
eukprot:6172560-Pyramimonas_sp.AAC.1